MHHSDSIIVLGANGFIGHALLSSLEGLGKRVVKVGRRPPADLIVDNANPEALPPKLLEGSTVIHLATSNVPGALAKHELACVHKELDDFARLLAHLDESGCRRFVFLSSGGCVYGSTSVELISEDHPTRPINPYGYLKLSCESLIHLYVHQCSFDAVILRPSNCYGPNQRARPGQGVIAHFIKRINSGQPIILFGDGSVERDYLHVDDLIAATVAVCGLVDLPRRVFNVGAGRTHSLISIIETLQTIVPDQIQIHYQPARPFDAPRICLDCSEFKAATGWSPVVQLEQGLHQQWLAFAGKPLV